MYLLIEVCSFVHTAPGYLCPSRHSQAVKPLWFGRTLMQYLVTCSIESIRHIAQFNTLCSFTIQFKIKHTAHSKLVTQWTAMILI